MKNLFNILFSIAETLAVVAFTMLLVTSAVAATNPTFTWIYGLGAAGLFYMAVDRIMRRTMSNC
jgi:hypothetical protein